jgi:hypothetical protein
MKQRPKLILVIGLVSVFFLSILVCVSASQTFLFSKELTVEEVRYDPNMNSYSSSLTDDGMLVANTYFRIDPAPSNSLEHRMMFSVTPYNQTEVDSLTLRFSANRGTPSVYCESDSILLDASFYERNNEIVLEIPDTGSYGPSTIRLDFILEPFGAERISFNAELSMHRSMPLQLTSQKAQMYIDAAIP